jgi:hypothetical protein
MVKLIIYNEDDDVTTEIKFPSSTGRFESIITAILDNDIELEDESFLYTRGERIQLNKTYYFENGQTIKIRNPLYFEGSSKRYNSVTTSLIKKLKISNNKGKLWRNIKEGINLFGKCKNDKCEAFGKEVIQNIKEDEYYLNLDSNEMECPMCNCNCIIRTAGFYKCSYSIQGKFRNLQENEDNEVKEYIKNEKTNGENMFKFKVFDNGIYYIKLFFKVSKF